MARDRTRARDAYPDGDPFRSGAPPPLLERTVPLAADVRRYRAGTARGDVTAGLAVAALAIPSAMAYAELAGLSAIVGLYALILPTVGYALLGSSRVLIIGPEGTIAALVGAAVLPLAAAGSPEAAGLAAVLALGVGLCFLLARLLRLGWIADYLSRPVMLGYIHGVALVIIISQLGKLLGLDIAADSTAGSLAEVVRELGDASGPTVAVGAAALAVLFVVRWRWPAAPGALLVVVGGIAASAWFGLSSDGVAVVGEVPAGLPSVGLPDDALDELLTLAPAAVGIFLVAFADEILTARTTAGKHGPPVAVDQELLGMGAANVASGLSQGLPVGASGSRTAVNLAIGGRSQVTGLVAAGAVVVVLTLLTGPIADLPKAVLGAAIVVAALGLFAPGEWRSLWVTDRAETAIALVTAFGVVVVGVLQAVLLAVALSIADVVRRSARPHDAVLGWDEQRGRYVDVAVSRRAEIAPGVVVYRLDDRLFFANARYVRGRVTEAIAGAPGTTHALVFDAEAVTHMDAAGIASLAQLVSDLKRSDVTVHVARAKGAIVDKLDGGEVVGLDALNLHGTVRAAVAAARS